MTDAGDMVAEEATEAALDYLEKHTEVKVAKSSMVEVEGRDIFITAEKGLKYHNSNITSTFCFSL